MPKGPQGQLSPAAIVPLRWIALRLAVMAGVMFILVFAAWHLTTIPTWLRVAAAGVVAYAISWITVITIRHRRNA